MVGVPPSRIPPYIGVVDKKRGDNPLKEILGKFFGKVGGPPSLMGPLPDISPQCMKKNFWKIYVFI
jgi:hypothetical protein